MAAARYTRQVRLSDVGPSGQERLGALRAHVPGRDLGARVEALYLAGAGVRTLVVEGEAIAEAARALNPEIEVAAAAERAEGGRNLGAELGLHEGAADVAEGALRALFKVREALFDANRDANRDRRDPN